MSFFGANRRKHERVEVDLNGEIERELGSKAAGMMMKNLSLGGCFIRTDHPEPPGAMVMVRFALPGGGVDEAVKAVGRVSWVRSDPDGPAGMGIQFVRVADRDLDRLKTYIAGAFEGEVFRSVVAA